MGEISLIKVTSATYGHKSVVGPDIERVGKLTVEYQVATAIERLNTTEAWIGPGHLSAKPQSEASFGNKLINLDCLDIGGSSATLHNTTGNNLSY